MDTRPIGVFDSGLGGLTAVRQLRRVLPGEDIIYFGDTGRVPYGSRGREIIRQYARQDIRFLLSHDVKFIIAACGTVSSTYPPEVISAVRSGFSGSTGTDTICPLMLANSSGRLNCSVYFWIMSGGRDAKLSGPRPTTRKVPATMS